MNRKLNLLAAVVGAAILGAMASQASAAIIYTISDGAVPLSNLLGTGNSLQVGDKIFDNFSYSTTGADMPSAANVNVTGETVVVDGTQTWGFLLSGAFQDTNTPGASDAILRYSVHVTDPTQNMIFGAAMLGDPDVIGTGKAQVTETWTPSLGSSKIRIYDLEPGSTTQFKDTLNFDTPVASLTVTKDILASVATGSQGSSAAITGIDQLYAQSPLGGGGTTPEPASLGLLAFGALGLLARRRR